MLSSDRGLRNRVNADVPETVIDIWCDGSCWEGYAGWAAILVARGKTREIFNGFGPGMTNQRAEMMAVIEGMSFIRGTGHTVRIHSDSAYVVNCFQQGWIENWRRKNWIKKGREVANRDLWETMESYVELHETTFHKVAGHAGVELNERADVLAGAARQRAYMDAVLKEQRAARIPTR